MRQMSRTIADADSFAQDHESHLQKRLGNIQEARSQIRESIELVEQLKNSKLDRRQQALILEKLSQHKEKAKAKLLAEQQAMLFVPKRVEEARRRSEEASQRSVLKIEAPQRFEEAPRGKSPVLSDHIIENLDDHLDEARQLIKDARAQLAAEPPLFPEVRSEEVVAPEDHEQGLKNIRQDLRTVRAAVAQ